jgi:hypothetical protein
MRRALDRPGRRDVDGRRCVEIADLIVRRLRGRIDVAPALIEQFDGRRRRGPEHIVRRADIEMQLAAVALVADIAVESPDERGRAHAIAIVAHGLQGAVNGIIADLLSRLQRGLHAPVGAAHDVDCRALKVEAVLHLHAERAAKRIQAKRRIVADHVDRTHRDRWNEVPIDRIAKGLVDPHAVLVDRQSLRRPRYGRSVKAAKLDIWLKRIARHLVDRDAGRLLRKRAHDAGRLRAFDLFGIDHCDRGGNLVDIDAGAR